MFARRDVDGLAEVLRHLGRACYMQGGRTAKTAGPAPPADDADPAVTQEEQQEEEAAPSFDALRSEVRAASLSCCCRRQGPHRCSQPHALTHTPPPPPPNNNSSWRRAT